MTTATATLTEFLLARIAEREAAALAATSGPWFTHGDAVSASPEERDEWGDLMGDPGPHVMHASFEDNGPANAAHIALHDPARVLARCATDRRIVEAARPIAIAGGPGWTPEDAAAERGRLDALETVLRELGAMDADHEDYREEWAL